MKPRFDLVLDQCIENGLKLGFSRAHKHEDNPREETLRFHLQQAIWEEIHEWFDMEQNND